MKASLKGSAASEVGNMLEDHVAHELTATVVTRTIPAQFGEEEYLSQDTWPTLVCLTCGVELLELDE